MTNSIRQLTSIVEGYTPQLQRLNQEQWSNKPDPVKWSRKEILGHLIDSAQTNIRRFITAQYEHNPRVTYQQDIWVKAANYQNYNTSDLLLLWQLINKHICMVLSNIPASAEERLSQTDAPHSIKWLAQDYNKHLLHHLHHLLDLEPIAYP